MNELKNKEFVFINLPIDINNFNDMGQEPMSRRITPPYIPVRTFSSTDLFLVRISLE